MPSLDEVLSSLSQDDYLHDSILLSIDEHLRVVSVPERGTVLGVSGDKKVNRVNFTIPRYYKGFDLSTFSIRINFANANGVTSYYVVTDAVTENNNILFSWLVDNVATDYVGTVRFIVKFVKMENEEVTQAFHSTVARATVLEGLEADHCMTSESQNEIMASLSEIWNDDAAESITDYVDKMRDFKTRLYTNMMRIGAMEDEIQDDMTYNDLISALGNLRALPKKLRGTDLIKAVYVALLCNVDVNDNIDEEVTTNMYNESAGTFNKFSPVDYISDVTVDCSSTVVSVSSITDEISEPSLTTA